MAIHRKIKVRNMESANGNKVANQFIIESNSDGRYKTSTFQSYSTVIARKIYDKKKMTISTVLDKDSWDYSVTTGKYRNQFLSETKKETEAKIASGKYKLVDLN